MEELTEAFVEDAVALLCGTAVAAGEITPDAVEGIARLPGSLGLATTRLQRPPAMPPVFSNSASVSPTWRLSALPHPKSLALREDQAVSKGPV